MQGQGGKPTTPESIRRRQLGPYLRHQDPHPTFSPHSKDQPNKSILSQDSLSMRSGEEKQTSVRSISTTRTASKLSYRINYEPISIQEEKESIISEELRNYANIERILKNENDNLKRQNDHLLREVYKLKQSNQKYKEAYKQIKLEAEAVTLQRDAQKQRADEMKQIIMNRLALLEGKIGQNGDGGCVLGVSDCQSILEALTLSDSGLK